VTSPLVIGLGNRWCGDDAVGPLVIDRLRELKIASVDLIESPADTLSLINAWAGRKQVLLVDACCDLSLDVGEVVIIESAAVDSAMLTRLNLPTSSHVLNLLQAIEMSRALGKVPESLTVFAVVGRQFAAGDQLSDEVESAIGEIVASLPGVVSGLAQD